MQADVKGIYVVLNALIIPLTGYYAAILLCLYDRCFLSNSMTLSIGHDSSFETAPPALNPCHYISFVMDLIARMLGYFTQLNLIIAAGPHVVTQYSPVQSKLAKFPSRNATRDSIFLEV